VSAKLAGLKEVYVAPGNAVTAAMSKPDDAKIAADLGVSVLVKGTIQSASDGLISIAVTMNDVKAGHELRFPEIKSNRKDLVTLKDNIFEQVVKSLTIQQTNEEKARTTLRPTADFDAYDLYLKGRNLLRGKQDPKSLQAAMDLFDQAIR